MKIGRWIRFLEFWYWCMHREGGRRYVRWSNAILDWIDKNRVKLLAFAYLLNDICVDERIRSRSTTMCLTWCIQILLFVYRKDFVSDSDSHEDKSTEWNLFALILSQISRRILFDIWKKKSTIMFDIMKYSYFWRHWRLQRVLDHYLSYASVSYALKKKLVTTTKWERIINFCSFTTMRSQKFTTLTRENRA